DYYCAVWHNSACIF
nr:immunoglobulin light chain junction region [Macaca mulatta]MOW29004.1 immunoglobulin light chain junction region [Macaca mulatta]